MLVSYALLCLGSSVLILRHRHTSHCDALAVLFLGGNDASFTALTGLVELRVRRVGVFGAVGGVVRWCRRSRGGAGGGRRSRLRGRRQSLVRLAAGSSTAGVLNVRGRRTRRGVYIDHGDSAERCRRATAVVAAAPLHRARPSALALMTIPRVLPSPPTATIWRPRPRSPRVLPRPRPTMASPAPALVLSLNPSALLAPAPRTAVASRPIASTVPIPLW